MDLEYLKQLIRLARKSGVTELEIEEDGVRIRLRNDPVGRGVTPIPFAAPEFIGIPGYGGHPLAPPQGVPAAAAAEEAKPVDKNLHYVESPMVGTFYRAPAPDAPPFVQTGTVVDANTVVCIIEAMKVMNEIKAGTAGVVAEVMVENGQPVEYGQPLFGVKTG